MTPALAVHPAAWLVLGPYLLLCAACLLVIVALPFVLVWHNDGAQRRPRLNLGADNGRIEFGVDNHAGPWALECQCDGCRSAAGRRP